MNGYYKKIQEMYENKLKMNAVKHAMVQIDNQIRNQNNKVKNINKLIENELKLKDSFKQSAHLKTQFQNLIKSNQKAVETIQRSVLSEQQIKEKLTSGIHKIEIPKVIVPGLSKEMNLLHKAFMPLLSIVDDIFNRQELTQMYKANEENNKRIKLFKNEMASKRNEVFSRARARFTIEQNKYKQAVEKGLPAVIDYKMLKTITNKELEEYKKYFKETPNKQRTVQDFQNKTGFSFSKVADLTQLRYKYNEWKRAYNSVKYAMNHKNDLDSLEAYEKIDFRYAAKIRQGEGEDLLKSLKLRLDDAELKIKNYKNQ
jgi:hypothetical protein